MPGAVAGAGGRRVGAGPSRASRDARRPIGGRPACWAALVFLQIVIVTIVRGGIRDLALGLHGLNVWDRRVESNWLVTVAFLVLFVCRAGSHRVVADRGGAGQEGGRAICLSRETLREVDAPSPEPDVSVVRRRLIGATVGVFGAGYAGTIGYPVFRYLHTPVERAALAAQGDRGVSAGGEGHSARPGAWASCSARGRPC